MMLDTNKFQKKLTCVCKNIVHFEIIPEIECDWGCHTIIQCLNVKNYFQLMLNVLHFKLLKNY